MSIHSNHPVYKRIKASGPKRILSLDGGGIRGALTLGYLEKIESILRHRYDNQSLVLSDYFDLVGGTSTGAIIATFIALGKPVDEIKELYLELGEKIFTKRKHPFNWWVFKYFLSAEFDHRILETELEKHKDIKDLTLGSEKFKTGLAIFTKRADTYNTFVFHNHPDNTYYKYNAGIYIKDLLRATSAAPSYFMPKEIIFNDGESAIFVDGGVSMVNNPSLMLFLMTTIKGYKYQWRKTKDHLLLISVGTGFHHTKVQKKEKGRLLRKKMYRWGQTLPIMFMKDATEQNQYLMQYFSNAKIPEIINEEAGDLTADLISEAPLLEYCRYNVNLGKNTLANMDIHLSDEELESITKMEIGENAKKLYEIGQVDATRTVSAYHLPPTFDFGLKEPLQEPISQTDTQNLINSVLNTLGKRYHKVVTVQARKAEPGEVIVSITSSGKETENTAEDGDFVIKNHQTESEELYIVTKDEFQDRYVHFRSLYDGVWSVYRSKGQVDAIELTKQVLDSLNLEKHFFIMADWGESQYVSIGDYLVTPVNKNEVYRIGRKEFKQTYDIL